MFDRPGSLHCCCTAEAVAVARESVKGAELAVELEDAATVEAVEAVEAMEATEWTRS